MILDDIAAYTRTRVEALKNIRVFMRCGMRLKEGPLVRIFKQP